MYGKNVYATITYVIYFSAIKQFNQLDIAIK